MVRRFGVGLRPVFTAKHPFDLTGREIVVEGAGEGAHRKIGSDAWEQERDLETGGRVDEAGDELRVGGWGRDAEPFGFRDGAERLFPAFARPDLKVDGRFVEAPQLPNASGGVGIRPKRSDVGVDGGACFRKAVQIRRIGFAGSLPLVTGSRGAAPKDARRFRRRLH